MTISSTDTINTTILRDGQAAGSITPLSMRTVTDSLSGTSVVNQTASYTFVSADRGTLITYTSASAGNFTIPLNVFDVGAILRVMWAGVGGPAFVAASGVTINTNGNFACAMRWGTMVATQQTLNVWVLSGDIMQIFKVQGGQIIDPTGRPFIAKGINIADWASVQSLASGGSNNGIAIMPLFPGINMIRLNMGATAGTTQFSGNTAQSYVDAFILRMTAARIVVFIEDHDGNGGVDNTLTGAALTAEITWYLSYSNAYINNPYVWLGMPNEPYNGTASAITTQQVALYNAIRGAGNLNPLIITPLGGYSTSANGGMTAASYTTMVNVIWDIHLYGWIAASNSTVWQTIFDAATLIIANVQNFTTSADGIIPVLIGEYGVSTVGVTPDTNGTQTVMVVQALGYGTIAWTWQAGTSDVLVTNASALTLSSYGHEVAAYIAGGETAGSTLGSSLWGTLGP